MRNDRKIQTISFYEVLEKKERLLLSLVNAIKCEESRTCYARYRLSANIVRNDAPDVVFLLRFPAPSIRLSRNRVELRLEYRATAASCSLPSVRGTRARTIRHPSVLTREP